MAIKARKRFAQHWLKDEHILQQIVAAANLSADDRVLEIGPGTGLLTRRLLPLVNALLAVEIDRDLCQHLANTLGQHPHFLLLQGDFLTLDIPPLLQAFPQFQDPTKVVANIPYNITGPILIALLGTIAQPQPRPYETIVLLVQKEIADRLQAKPSTKAYGALSVRVQYLATCTTVCPVPARAFSPPPKVDSAVICLRPYPAEAVHEHRAQNPKHLDQLLTMGFATRRKMLRNNLTSWVDRDQCADILSHLDIQPNARAEDLGLGDWVRLSNYLLSNQMGCP